MKPKHQEILDTFGLEVCTSISEDDTTSVVALAPAVTIRRATIDEASGGSATITETQVDAATVLGTELGAGYDSAAVLALLRERFEIPSDAEATRRALALVSAICGA